MLLKCSLSVLTTGFRLHLILILDSFFPFISIFLLDLDVRLNLRRSTLSYFCVVTILFSVVRGRLLFPSSCFLSFTFLISISVPRVATDILCLLFYYPACRSRRLETDGRHFSQFTVLDFSPTTTEAPLVLQHYCVHLTLGDFFRSNLIDPPCSFNKPPEGSHSSTRTEVPEHTEAPHSSRMPREWVKANTFSSPWPVISFVVVVFVVAYHSGRAFSGEGLRPIAC